MTATAVREASAPALPRAPRSPHRLEPSRVTRWVILGAASIFLFTPLIALVGFTMRGGLEGGATLSHWAAAFSGDLGAAQRPLTQGIVNSLILAGATVAITLVLLVPTMVFVRLNLPRWEKPMEFVSLLPLTIPAVAMVVGFAPVFKVISKVAGSAPWTLAFAYVVLSLPYAYRAIQANLVAVDVRTLSQAARSLGASWPSVLLLVLLPNLRRGILAASFITVAAVLGEFTLASLLSRNNLQTALVLVAKQDPYLSNIVVVIALALTLVLLFAIGRLGATHRKSGS